VNRNVRRKQQTNQHFYLIACFLRLLVDSLTAYVFLCVVALKVTMYYPKFCVTILEIDPRFRMEGKLINRILN